MKPDKLPKCAIVMTHFNYSHLVFEAIVSVVEQSHDEFELIIVDDHSSKAHFDALQRCVKLLRDDRVRIKRLPRNMGQIHAIFEGLNDTDAEFVALLDPDDQYHPDFLSRMLEAHLNGTCNAALVSCDMGVFRSDGSVLSRHYLRPSHIQGENIQNFCQPDQQLIYYAPWHVGWFWSTTSGMMFRRDALEVIRPTQKAFETKVHGDSYCVYGAHMAGGTILLAETLSWRGLHEDNSAESSRLFSQFQKRHRVDFKDQSLEVKHAAMEAFITRGGADLLGAEALCNIVACHFDPQTRFDWIKRIPDFRAAAIKAAIAGT